MIIIIMVTITTITMVTITMIMIQIRELEPGRSVARDGRVRPGDLLLALNYESLWRVSLNIIAD